MKKIVLIPVSTIGDALILLIAANHLHHAGYEVTIMHDKIISLKNWFLNFHFEKFNFKNLYLYDHIYIQHGSDEKKINNIKKPVSWIYFRYVKFKHPPLSDLDIAIDESLPIAKSLAKKFTEIFKKDLFTQTGLTIPSGLTFKKHPKRIIIHPSSSDKKKCWPKVKYIKLAKKLKKLGFQPVICISSQEKKTWREKNLDLISFDNLNDFTSYLYESNYLIGNDSFAVHLASLLNINHIIITSNKKLLKTWQPGWLKSHFVLPPNWVPNFKYFRIRENHFQFFINTKKIINKFLATYSI